MTINFNSGKGPELNLRNILPDLDDTNFLEFLKAYYKWLESSRIELIKTNGTFVKGETVTGDESGASGIVRQVGDGFLVLEMVSARGFDVQEILRGDTSNASAEIYEIVDNVIRKVDNLVKNRDSDTSTGEYFELLKEELNRNIPTKTFGDRRFLLSKYKDLFSAKSTEDAYRFFFESIFGIAIDFRLPGEEILRVSDGRFDRSSIIRARPPTQIVGEPEIDLFDMINKTIRGRTSGAVGNVVYIRRTYLSGEEIVELTMSLVSGEFVEDEEIYVIGDERIATTIHGMLVAFSIDDGGTGYSVGEEITITTLSGDGELARGSIVEINSGEIDAINYLTLGQGYRLGTVATVNNTNTTGEEFQVRVTEIRDTYVVTEGSNEYLVGEATKVTITNRGKNYNKAPVVSLVDPVISDLGLLSTKLMTIDNPGTAYTIGDNIPINDPAEVTVSAYLQVASIDDSVDEDLLFEDGFGFVLEYSDQYESGKLLTESSTLTGPIERLELLEFGRGYLTENLPTVDTASVGSGDAQITVTAIQGVNANVEVDVANNSVGLGSIKLIELADFGKDYSSTDTIQVDVDTVGGVGAVITPIISGIGTTAGRWLTTDSIIGRRVIQDSYFYQDFAYVIRSGLGFNSYQNLLKDIIHPAGMEFFGEILIKSFISLTPEFWSQINSEKNTALTTFLTSVLSFFDEEIAPPTKQEYNVEFSTKLDPVLESDREINVEITPRIDTSMSVIEQQRFEIDIILDVDVSDIDQSTEINLELTPEPINIESSNVTEFNVEYATRISPVLSGNYSFYEITLESAFDVSVVGLDVNISTKLGVQSQIEVSAENRTEFNVEYATRISPTLSGTFSFYEPTIESLFDVSVTGLEVQISTKLGVQSQTEVSVLNQTELNIEYSTKISPKLVGTFSFYETTIESAFDVSVVANQVVIERRVEIEKLVPVGLDHSSSLELDFSSEIPVIADPIKEYKLILDTYLPQSYDITVDLEKVIVRKTSVEIAAFNQVEVNNIYYEDVNISALASDPISAYADKTFEDLYGQRTIQKHNKIIGSVDVNGTSVTGNGTTFSTEFNEGDFIIIGNEKFIVVSINSNVSLELNVAASQIYTNEAAYQEFLL